MSDTKVDNLEENEEYEKKEEEDEKKEVSDEENVVINIEPKKKPRKQMSAEDRSAMLDRLKRGREAAHAKRRLLESSVKLEKIKKLQSEVDSAKNDPIIKTNKKEYKEQKEDQEVQDVTIVKKKKKKKKVIIEESDSSSDEEIIVRRKSKSRQTPLTPTPPPTPPPVARRVPPTAVERAAVIERAEAARKLAFQIAQQKVQQAQMMKSIFG